MNTPMNQKVKFIKEDGVDKVDEAYFRSLFMHCASELHLKAAKSTTKAEFVATTIVVNQAIWLRNILANLGLKQDQSKKEFVDNQIVISISYNPMFREKTKNFNVKLFYLREVQENGDVSLVYCKIKSQVVDMFTMSFSLNRFKILRKKLGICSL
ncbi:Copia protein, partial [Mucuna pruriens]